MDSTASSATWEGSFRVLLWFPYFITRRILRPLSLWRWIIIGIITTHGPFVCVLCLDCCDMIFALSQLAWWSPQNQRNALRINAWMCFLYQLLIFHSRQNHCNGLKSVSFSFLLTPFELYFNIARCILIRLLLMRFTSICLDKLYLRGYFL